MRCKRRHSCKRVHGLLILVVFLFCAIGFYSKLDRVSVPMKPPDDLKAPKTGNYSENLDDDTVYSVRKGVRIDKSYSVDWSHVEPYSTSSQQKVLPSLSVTAKQELPVSRIVHTILWTDTMHFRNYLCLLSVSKFLRPYLIILYTKTSFKSRSSQLSYNDWFEKAASRIPLLQVRKNEFLDTINYSPMKEATFALTVLRKIGGVFVNMNTIVNADLWLDQNQALQTQIGRQLGLGFVIQVETPTTVRFLSGISGKTKSDCVPLDIFTGSEICCIISKDIYPVNIMWTKSPFGALARTLLYGKLDIPLPSRSFPPIPKIVHYVWFGDKDITYSMYLSFLSTLKFVMPVKIYVYVNTKIRKYSFYFDKMAAHSNVEIAYYGPITHIYQNRLTNLEHVSDIVRADVLFRVGGIYLDWDVFWMKPAEPLLSEGYETVAALDFLVDMYPRQEFPDTINMGVLLARPKSRFIAKWQDSFKKYTGKHSTYHAVEMVYKLYEEQPDLLVLHDRLQIMCFGLKCHPLWLRDYKNANVHHTFDFRKDVYTVHFTDPYPQAFQSEVALKHAKGFFADMARHIVGQ